MLALDQWGFRAGSWLWVMPKSLEIPSHDGRSRVALECRSLLEYCRCRLADVDGWMDIEPRVTALEHINIVVAPFWKAVGGELCRSQ